MPGEVLMSKHAAIPTEFDPVAREEFYHLIGQVPESEAAWQERQATLRAWRAQPRFGPFWPSIDHMLADDFASCRRRATAMQGAMETAHLLEGYDFDAWREQREHDRNHAHDHLP
jgi:hypothetical protein